MSSEEACRWVRKLGDMADPDDIAAYLRAQGIRGEVGRSQSCVVAEFIRSKLDPTSYVSVDREYIGYTSAGGYDPVHMNTPHNLTQFIDLFDELYYPYLIGGEES